jgi:chromosome segregation protein
MQSALDDARTKSEALADTLSRLKFELVTAAEAVKEATREADARLSVLHESDAEMAAVAEQLGHLASTVRNANAEAERLKNALGAATSALDADNASLTELAQRFEAAGQTLRPNHRPSAAIVSLAKSKCHARPKLMHASQCAPTKSARVRRPPPLTTLSELLVTSANLAAVSQSAKNAVLAKLLSQVLY